MLRSVIAPRGTREQGFSLVELMVALTLGLVVSGAALTLIVSILRANGDTIQSTRLNQELRAVTEIVAREIKRARAIADPIANIGRGTAASIPVEAITIDDAAPAIGTAGECIAFAYQFRRAEDDATIISRFVSVRLDGEDIVVAVNEVTDADPDPAVEAVDCDADGTVINSPQIEITEFSVTPVTATAVQVEITGRMRVANADVSRSFTETVKIRSSTLGT